MKKLSMIALCIFCLFSSQKISKEIAWTELETGLHYVSISLSPKSELGDSKVDILKINPKNFDFQLICAGEKKCTSKIASTWAEENKLIALVNAGMFKLEGDLKTGTGYMKNYNYINNPNMNPIYKNIMAFNPKDLSVPAAQIIDLNCENWKELKNKYNSFSQGIRMINCEKQNTWQLNQKKWSMVLLGEDSRQNILFIFVRSPYKVHDYINHLLKLDIGLTRLMYLEGGPEASFFLNHPKLHLQKMGSYETGFNENDNNKEYWQIPNVIGIKRKK